MPFGDKRQTSFARSGATMLGGWILLHTHHPLERVRGNQDNSLRGRVRIDLSAFSSAAIDPHSRHTSRDASQVLCGTPVQQLLGRKGGQGLNSLRALSKNSFLRSCALRSTVESLRLT
jgi:hypothetical protein